MKPVKQRIPVALKSFGNNKKGIVTFTLQCHRDMLDFKPTDFILAEYRTIILEVQFEN